MHDDFEIRFCEEDFLREHAKAFACLCRDAFAEHASRGVNMGPNTMTAEKFCDWAKGCVSECLFAGEKLVGFWMARLDEKKKVAHGRILAVSPEMKGKHLGSRLALARERVLRERGMNVFVTDTSLNAPHVVAFHKSYGCKAVGMTSWSNTNYYTVILRKALAPEFEISDEEAEKCFRRSAFWCKLRLNEDGTKTAFGCVTSLALYPLSLAKRIARRILR